MEAANAALRPYHIAFEEIPEWKRFPEAFGGYSADLERIALNPRKWPLRQVVAWPVVISHELAHADQMARASAAGASPKEIVRRKLAYMTPGGRMDYTRYLSDPLELQALARNAVDAVPGSAAQHLRQGTLSRYAPLPPGNLRRFGKYAYEIATARGKLGEGTARSFLLARRRPYRVELEKMYRRPDDTTYTIKGWMQVVAPSAKEARAQVEKRIARTQRGLDSLYSTDARITWEGAPRDYEWYVNFSFGPTGVVSELDAA